MAIRYGALDDGYLFECQIYQGKGSQTEYQKEFGHGPGVDLGLMYKLPENNYQVYLDNFFTSLKLLKHLSGKSIGCTGTFNRRMFELCPFPDDATMMNQGRGTYKSFVHSEYEVQLTKWQDNKAVMVGSNFQCDSPPDTCQRWSAQKKSYISI